ncbi:hypothetical protein ACE6H2_026655 [Prunus campanulata]
MVDTLGASVFPNLPKALEQLLVDSEINNVGTAEAKATLDCTAEDFAFVTSTNLEFSYHLSQLAHPLLKASGAGNIVFISSVAGSVSVAGIGSIYAATKGAVNQLARSFACEWGKDNIRVNSVAPWFIKTPLSANVLPPSWLLCNKSSMISPSPETLTLVSPSDSVASCSPLFVAFPTLDMESHLYLSR